jgi:hypothetical protein
MKKAKIEVTDLFAMSNLGPNNSGLPVPIWIEEKATDDLNKLPHYARIKVSNKRDNINIKETSAVKFNDHEIIFTKECPTSFRKPVERWIILNRDILLKHWNKEIDSADMFDNLKKIIPKNKQLRSLINKRKEKE